MPLTSRMITVLLQEHGVNRTQTYLLHRLSSNWKPICYRILTIVCWCLSHTYVAYTTGIQITDSEYRLQKTRQLLVYTHDGNLRGDDSFWNIAKSSLSGVDRRFRGAYWLPNRGDKSSLHGAISQKVLIFILAAVITWNLTLPSWLIFRINTTNCATRFKTGVCADYTTQIKSVTTWCHLSRTTPQTPLQFALWPIAYELTHRVSLNPNINTGKRIKGRSQWPRGLRRRSAVTWLLGSRVRIPLRTRMFVSCLYVVLSCVGIGLCDGMITCPKESYSVP
jgi:hypothetical protein